MGCVEVYAVRLNATHDIFDQAWCVPGLTPLWLASRLDFMGCVEVYAVRLNATHDICGEYLRPGLVRTWSHTSVAHEPLRFHGLR